MVRIFLLISFFSHIYAQTIPAPAIEFNPEKYVCYRTQNPVQIDGKLNEPDWNKAEWTKDFVDIEGYTKPVPRFRTRVKMLWDEKNFYIAAMLEEPDIWGTLVNRDDIIFYDNDFEVFIDPDGNTRSYAEFEMNALNTIWDLLLLMPYRDMDQAAVHGWDIKGVKSGVFIKGTLNKTGDTDEFWTVEIAFPFEAFKEIAKVDIPPKDGDQWRVNFSRVEWKTEIKNGQYQKQINPVTGKSFPEDNWVWSPQGVVNMHYPEMWGYVQFSSQIPGSPQVVFQQDNKEAAKWFLRQLYYQQNYYYTENGRYSCSLENLHIKYKPLPLFSNAPVIECTTNMYEVYLQADNNNYRIYINQSGFTWEKKYQNE